MQFDVYQNPNVATKARFPLLLDVQAELLSELDTRMVVPLALREGMAERVITQLTPIVQIGHTEYVAVVTQMSGIAKRQLGRGVANLASARYQLLAALDFLFTGI